MTIGVAQLIGVQWQSFEQAEETASPDCDMHPDK